MDKELKDQRITIMMTATELAAIDDWSFTNRIRSRGEAIRQLCLAGLEPGRQKRITAVGVEAYQNPKRTTLSISTGNMVGEAIDVYLSPELVAKLLKELGQ